LNIQCTKRHSVLTDRDIIQQKNSDKTIRLYSINIHTSKQNTYKIRPQCNYKAVTLSSMSTWHYDVLHTTLWRPDIFHWIARHHRRV